MVQAGPALYYHLAFGRAAKAVSIGQHCLSEPTEADRDYLSRVGVATAEALAAAGDLERAAALVSKIATGHCGELPEFIAATQRVSGRLSTDSRPAAFEHYARSARVFGHIGHIIGRGEALYNAAALRASLAATAGPDGDVPHITTFYMRPDASFGRVDVPSDATPATMPEAMAATARAAAAMVDLASRPTLAGYELLSMAASTGAAARAVMLCRKGDSAEVAGWVGSDQADATLLHPSDDCVTIELGAEGDREVSRRRATAQPAVGEDDAAGLAATRRQRTDPASGGRRGERKIRHLAGAPAGTATWLRVRVRVHA